jgi:hypothetical protein
MASRSQNTRWQMIVADDRGGCLELGSPLAADIARILARQANPR